ncbi:hypothetical protein [Polaribacter staleyi]|uniref:hypothetical protein n=1 Tax=Polaribacter staleyi TaxID=2022337 RepID=UPI0031BAA3F7
MNPIEHVRRRGKLRLEFTKNFDGIINQAKNNESTKNLPLNLMVSEYTKTLKNQYIGTEAGNRIIETYKVDKKQISELIEQAAEITIKRFS